MLYCITYPLKCRASGIEVGFNLLITQRLDDNSALEGESFSLGGFLIFGLARADNEWGQMVSMVGIDCLDAGGASGVVPLSGQRFAGQHARFLFQPTRDATSAKAFLLKTLTASHTSSPRVRGAGQTCGLPQSLQRTQGRRTPARKL
jgi:hypothetical protein